MLDYLRSVCPDVRIVRGDFDDAALAASWSDTALLTLGGLRVGLTHGHACVPWGDPAAVALVARRLGADVLVSGHSHALRAAVSPEGVLHIDPGSATGAAPAFQCGSSGAQAGEPSTPSFVLMDVADGRATVYTYRLVEGASPEAGKSVKVEKLAYVKGVAPAAVGGGGGGAAPGAPAAAAAPPSPAPAPPAAA
jgi:vacuolar protein sorting-associated protein 29